MFIFPMWPLSQESLFFNLKNHNFNGSLQNKFDTIKFVPHVLDFRFEFPFFHAKNLSSPNQCNFFFQINVIYFIFPMMLVIVYKER